MVELRQVKLSLVRENPHRDLSLYPIDKEKVEALKGSIERTGWWPNIVARKNGQGCYEIAHGHHRFVALRELGKKQMGMLVGKFTDGEMLKMMADENLREWGSSAIIDQETVRAVVLAYAKGQIELEKPDAKTPKTRLRYAPGFVKGDDRVGSSDHPYTRDAVVAYLGWPENKVRSALAALEIQEEAGIPSSVYKGLSVDGAARLAREIKSVASEWDSTISVLDKMAAKESATNKAKKRHAETADEAREKKAENVKKAAVSIARELRGNKDERVAGIAESYKPAKIIEVDTRIEISEGAIKLCRWLAGLASTSQVEQLSEIVRERRWLSVEARRALCDRLESTANLFSEAAGKLSN